ncbi:MAG: type II toxin-antitoxin system VapB family antitoxin [Aeromicrobium sp.]|nr:type II toxin-antitoxin system VapB family antitoxin [Burkholderiales bacterium]
MSYLFNVDKELIREAMKVGGHRTQIGVVREALRLYVEKRRPSAQRNSNDEVPPPCMSSRI